jgi:hypothetical protein
MAFFTNGDLLAIEFSQDVIKPSRFSFVRQLADMLDVVHLY